MAVHFAGPPPGASVASRQCYDDRFMVMENVLLLLTLASCGNMRLNAEYDREGEVGNQRVVDTGPA